MQPTHYLRKISRLAGGSVFLSIAAFGARAQSLPAMPPTSQAVQSSPASPAVVTPATNTPLHAEVVYTNGQLQIRADNSSLNQILRSISHVAGLKITGGVEEQRVFGNYGPAPLSTILAMLLDGTGANILLLGGSAGSSPELVLTPRAGGAELPGPNSAVYAMYDDKNDRANPVPPPGTRVSGPPSELQTPAVVTPSNVITPSAVAPPATARVPGQPLTPEMVAQELMQMQAQQDQKKKELDDKMQQQQVDQRKKLDGTQPPSQTIQPTNSQIPSNNEILA